MSRPLGITILAIWNYLCAGWGVLLGIVALSGASAVVAILDTLERATPHDPATYSLLLRTGFAAFAFGGAVLAYYIGKGFWKLQNWARVTTIIFCVIDLIASQSMFARLISLIVTAYLISEHVKTAFVVQTNRPTTS